MRAHLQKMTHALLGCDMRSTYSSAVAISAGLGSGVSRRGVADVVAAKQQDWGAFIASRT